ALQPQGGGRHDGHRTGLHRADAGDLHAGAADPRGTHQRVQPRLDSRPAARLQRGGEHPVARERGPGGARPLPVLQEHPVRAGLAGCADGAGVFGRSVATATPARARTASTIIAMTYVVLPEARSETRIVPAIAVPNDEPRLEMLRDRPEISPCCCSAKLDWT